MRPLVCQVLIIAKTVQSASLDFTALLIVVQRVIEDVQSAQQVTIPHLQTNYNVQFARTKLGAFLEPLSVHSVLHVGQVLRF